MPSLEKTANVSSSENHIEERKLQAESKIKTAQTFCCFWFTSLTVRFLQRKKTRVKLQNFFDFLFISFLEFKTKGYEIFFYYFFFLLFWLIFRVAMFVFLFFIWFHFDYWTYNGLLFFPFFSILNKQNRKIYFCELTILVPDFIRRYFLRILQTVPGKTISFSFHLFFPGKEYYKRTKKRKNSWKWEVKKSNTILVFSVIYYPNKFQWSENQNSTEEH